MQEQNGWTKNTDTPGNHKVVPFESALGQRVLNDLAIRYPHFKPKYIGQDHIDGEPSDMVAAYALGPEDVRVDIKNVPIPEEHINDIDGVSYILTGDMLIFQKAYPRYEAATVQEYQIRPDLLEFYEQYQQLKQSSPYVVEMIELFATVYEQKLAKYNGTYEPLALRELLWHFISVQHS